MMRIDGNEPAEATGTREGGPETQPRPGQHNVVKLSLPPAPSSERGSVRSWSEQIDVLTYEAGDPDPNPLFLEARVYQGSSGRVYPLPVIDSIKTTPVMKAWEAVHIENEYLRLMVLPEMGGRIHVGLDKRTGYDFFYRQNVIKPALVGLAGPWVSGGVEFNWPQHHRPATFMPVNVAIDREPDGSVTIWCSDHDPMERMKGMHGICLRPGKAYVEVKVRLYNRTTQTQTFLWWANVATHVNEFYQSFFPPDARFAADHAKRALTTYPLSKGVYYGINYGERSRTGVPAEETPARFVPDGSYARNDLGWYANIPVPTSYMIVGSGGDFFGGYDHARDAGTLAYANHHVVPGKKQWTWGNHEFGYAWDRSLTDADGPYVELMSGAYTDNQPDFSFLAPGETKTFSQFWYPISGTGVPDVAILEGALRAERLSHGVRVHVQVTEGRPGSTVRVVLGGRELAPWRGDLTPEDTLHLDFPCSGGEQGALVVLVEWAGSVLLRYAPEESVPVQEPDVATEPPAPEQVRSVDELYLNGLHLEQYRHPTRLPEVYWQEALRRDPGDSRCNHALGRWHFKRGEVELAEKFLLASIARLTERNPNPEDGGPFYSLGLTQLHLGHVAEAYASFYKSTWAAAWRAPAYHRIAEIDMSRHDWAKALDHLDQSLRAETDNLNARNLKTIVLRKLNRLSDAEGLLSETRALDCLHIFSNWLTKGVVPQDGQERIDLVLDLRRAGLFQEAYAVLSAPRESSVDGTEPLLLYLCGALLEALGRGGEASDAFERASQADPTYVFPNRIDLMTILKCVVTKRPKDARAPYYLGNFLYDRRRDAEAISLWEKATKLDPSFPTAWRNLAFAYFNVLHDENRSREAFGKARAAAPNSARILYEQDQLLKKVGVSPALRLAELEADHHLVEMRDDLTVELAALYNSQGDAQRALDVLLGRQFHPWEGGEGLALTQFVRAHVLLAVKALQDGDLTSSFAHLKSAGEPPLSLSEAKHLLMNLSMIEYWVGKAHADAGEFDLALRHWEMAGNRKGDFQQMQVQAISESTFWSAMALRACGHEQEACKVFQSILDYSHDLERQEPTIDYFATSLPAMTLFVEDLRKTQYINARFLQAEALTGLGRSQEAREALQQVLALDGSHAAAIDFARVLGV